MTIAFERPVRVAIALVLTIAVFGAAGTRSASAAEPAESTVSAAEQKVFVDDHLGGVGGVQSLRYRFRRTGSLDKPFDDTVTMTIRSTAPSHRAVQVAYLTGERKVSLPEIDDAKANPVILYFLEQDVRDMHRHLGGSENYFRRRIRLALADGAEINRTSIAVDGRPVEATEIVIRPFVGDPLKARLGAYENKTYAFALSDRVPGQVIRLRSRVVAGTVPSGDGASGSQPLLEDVLTFERAER